MLAPSKIYAVKTGQPQVFQPRRTLRTAGANDKYTKFPGIGQQPGGGFMLRNRLCLAVDDNLWATVLQNAAPPRPYRLSHTR